MIAKFVDCENGQDQNIEFIKGNETLWIAGYEYDKSHVFEIQLSKEDLFNLIGHLLRIQSEIKKGE